MIFEKKKENMFTKNDEAIIETLKNIVHGLSLFLGNDTEIVLHSFKDNEHSVVAIENGYITNRKVGSTLTEAGSKIIKDIVSKDKNLIGPYRSLSPNGILLRSVTISIKNKNKLIGLLCINMDINRVIQAEEFLKPFVHFEDQKISNGDLEKRGTALLSNLKDQIFEEAIVKVESKGQIPQKEKNKFIVEDLYQKDFFNLKDSVEFVAKKLRVSIFTIYNYIRDLKNGKGGKDGEKHNRKNS